MQETCFYTVQGGMRRADEVQVLVAPPLCRQKILNCISLFSVDQICLERSAWSYVQVITAIQEGRAHLEVYPNMPDMYMVTAYLEAEHNGTLDQWIKEQEDAYAFRQQQR